MFNFWASPHCSLYVTHRMVEQPMSFVMARVRRNKYGSHCQGSSQLLWIDLRRSFLMFCSWVTLIDEMNKYFFQNSTKPKCCRVFKSLRLPARYWECLCGQRRAFPQVHMWPGMAWGIWGWTRCPCACRICVCSIRLRENVDDWGFSFCACPHDCGYKGISTLGGGGKLLHKRMNTHTDIYIQTQPSKASSQDAYGWGWSHIGPPFLSKGSWI